MTPASDAPHSLIVGCGDTGVRVAARAIAAGERVTGIVRGERSAARVREVGARSLRLDLDRDALELPSFDRLFYFAPPPREDESDTRMARVLAALPCKPRTTVYISTSGVYGDCGGEWVDETRPVAPESARGKRRADAERRILAFDAAATILRAPGIYGPNRLPVQRVIDREPIVDDAEGGYSNRIHIDDLAAMAWLAGTRPPARRIYNACDGDPTPLGVYYDTLAELLGVAPVPRISWAQAQAEFSTMRLSFLRESRRLSNARWVQDTGYVFAFPDYRAGLRASLPAEPPSD